MIFENALLVDALFLLLPFFVDGSHFGILVFATLNWNCLFVNWKPDINDGKDGWP